jgi:hypothetical protein
MAIWTLNHNFASASNAVWVAWFSIADPRFLHYRRIFTLAKFSRSEPKSWMTRFTGQSLPEFSFSSGRGSLPQ